MNHSLLPDKPAGGETDSDVEQAGRWRGRDLVFGVRADCDDPRDLVSRVKGIDGVDLGRNEK